MTQILLLLIIILIHHLYGIKRLNKHVNKVNLKFVVQSIVL